MGLGSCRPIRVPMMTTVHLSSVPLDLGAMEEGIWSDESLFFHMTWLAVYIWQWCSLVEVSSFSRIRPLATLHTLFSNSVQFKVFVSKFPRSQSKWASVGCVGPTLIHGSSTSQSTGVEGSAANVLVPNTTGHFQGSSRVHFSVVSAVLAAWGGTKTC